MTRWLTLVTLVTLPAALGAQSDDNAPIVLELTGSASAAALGGAFVFFRVIPGSQSGSEPEAIFFHPGALSSARGASIAVQRYGSEAAFGTVAAARSWAGGVLAVGVQALTYGTGDLGFPLLPDDANRLLAGGPIGATELVGSVGYARDILGFDVGLVGKVIEQRVGGNRDATGAVDIGVTRRFFGFDWGVSAQHLGPDVQLGGGDVPLPYRVTFGVSSRSRAIGPIDVTGAGTVARRRDGEIVPGAGVEISWWPVIGRTFIGRIGVRRTPGDGASPVTFGAGFRGDNITIEYAFEGFDAPGSGHRIGVRWQ